MSNIVNTKTVIIGAGVSGISTAVNLLKKNYNDLLIFEALDRIGGRVNTIDYGDSFLEIGAQYIHGQKNNPIYYIARENKLIDKRYNEVIDDSDSDSDDEDDNAYIYARSDGKKVNPDIADKLEAALEKILDDLEATGNRDMSLGERLYEKYIQRAEKIFPKDFHKSDFRRLIDGMFVSKCRLENVETACFSLYQMSLKNSDAYEDLDGADIELIKGYRSVIETIIKPVKEKFNARLNLNSPLIKILLFGSSDHGLYTKNRKKVVLLFENKVVVCDNVVCTMSLGYMKENLHKIIEPASLVPEEKLRAVKRLGFGTVNKIFLIYDKPFWNKALIEMYPICVPEEGQTVKSALNDISESNWAEHLASFETFKRFPNMLVAWIGGDVFSENLSDEEVSRDITEYLRRLLGQQDIPEPKSIKRSRWNSNQYFRGSYTNMPLGSFKEDFSKIAEPIYLNDELAIMFAGEATLKNYHSTVHGAFVSGQREAQRILDDFED